MEFESRIFFYVVLFPEVWLRSKCPSNRPQTWLEGHRREWQLLLPIAAVDKIMEAGESIHWPDYKTEVSTLLRCSELGRHVFGFVMVQITEALVKDTIDKHINTLRARSSLTESDVVTCRNSIKTELEGVPGIAELGERRQISLSYRGWVIQASTKSLEEQVAMSVHSVLRGWLSQLELIPRLPAEVLLTSHDAELKVTKVEAVLYRDAKVSREHLAMVMKAADVKEGALVKASVVQPHPTPENREIGSIGVVRKEVETEIN
eukprot:1507678-Amphidinium_carterae.1